VLSDGHLQELARRRPDSLEALRTNRRFPSSVLRKDGPALLEVIAASRDTPAPPPLRPWPAAWAELLRAATPALAPGVAPDLVWSDSTLTRLHAGGTLEAWQLDLLGERAPSLLEGRAGLTVDGRLVAAAPLV
jgi:ribonuclease D